MLARLMRHWLKSLKPFLLLAAFFAILASAFSVMSAQNPVFRPGIDIVQPKLLNGHFFPSIQKPVRAMVTEKEQMVRALRNAMFSIIGFLTILICG